MTGVAEKFVAALKTQLGDAGPIAPAGRECPASLTLAREEQIDERIVIAATADALELPFAESLSDFTVSREFIGAVPISFARRHCLIGLTSDDGFLVTALADLSQWSHLQSVSKVLGKPIRPVFAPREEVLRIINLAYQQSSGQADQLIGELGGDEILRELDHVAGNEDLLDVSGRAPVIKLVNLVLLEAVKHRASDVHVQPSEGRLVVRFRIDGVLRDAFTPPKALQSEIISRIKVMAGMNIAEQRMAQDGRATVEMGDRIVDLRISTLPTNFGERAVIRLLDKSFHLYTLDDLGMPPAARDSFRSLVHNDHGLVLVTGPTGSGKSTTLYAALQEINSQELNILTLEDPIEFRLEGISQTQVSERKGMNFAGGLRHVSRQDPDIIMVGEIRDGETARMAIQSALTGHLVFSTLHTNDASGAITRMLDLGVEPFLLASSLLGVLAQRLVRRICLECRAPYTPVLEDCARWALAPDEAKELHFFKGTGCPACQNSGYRDRMGIFEFLRITEPVRELILQRGKASSIRSMALQDGMTALRAAGIAKVVEGTTTMDEVARVTGRTDF